MNISKHFGGKLIDMEPELEPGFDLNYPVPLSKELPGFSGSGSEPGSITKLKSDNPTDILWFLIASCIAFQF